MWRSKNRNLKLNKIQLVTVAKTSQTNITGGIPIKTHAERKLLY